MSSTAKLAPPGDMEVLITFCSHPSMKPTHAIGLYFSDFPGLETEWVRDELMALAHERVKYPTYDLSVKEDHFSWGADASAASVIIQLAADVGVALSVDLATRYVLRLAKRARNKIEPLDRASAIEYATGRIPIAFHEKRKHLRVVKEVEEKPGKRWVVTLRSTKSGDTYRVRVTRIRGRAVSANMERKAGAASC